MTKATAARGTTPRELSHKEKNEIKLWFGWGSLLGFPTGPKAYLKDSMKPGNKKLFLEMPRDLRKAVLRFVIDESNRRAA